MLPDASLSTPRSRDGDAEESAARVQQLRLLGVEERLRRWARGGVCTTRAYRGFGMQS